jgi:hypothetical protein
MFFLLRTGLVVSFIFYFSPVRQEVETPAHLPGPVAQVEAVWRDLSVEARKAVVEELRTSAGASLNEAAQRLAGGKVDGQKRP